MTQFFQLHLLTSYPPANLNRDDVGRPKTAVMGGVTRLRISSQSLKRAWRTSPAFKSALPGAIGVRTKRMGAEALSRLEKRGMDAEQAATIANQIANKLGKAEEGGETGQLVHLSPEEKAAIEQLVDRLAAEKRGPTEEELQLFHRNPHAADIALFGRMVAAPTQYNVEAACQVAHAVTVHEVSVEDDFFTAVDDLNDPSEAGSDMGAGHVGETGFAAGLFYLYLCLDYDHLLENLEGDRALADSAVRALAEAAAKVAPSGKQNSFASRAYASYALAERGTETPRSLAAAFLKPVGGKDYFTAAIQALDATLQGFDQVYGQGDVARYHFDVRAGQGSLSGLQNFLVSGPGPGAG